MGPGLDFTDLQWRRRPYVQQTAYAETKLANCLFASELQARMRQCGIMSVAVHPGVVHTDLYAGMLRGGPLAVLERLRSFAFYLVIKSPRQAARTVAFACVAPSHSLSEV